MDMLEGRSAAQKEKIIESVFKAFEENGISREWVTIVISDLPQENWAISGEMLSEKLKKEK
ncbi:MAG: tautomerase family protein [Candidatus Diapherotrites archaeon]|nr:tautomerase family protein [Candidatus Diapherotrites archaeon]